MSYAVYLRVEAQTYQKFISIQERLNAGEKQKLAHELGDVLADVSVQIIQQAFIDLLEQQKRRLTRPEGHKVAADSEKVIEHVLSAFKKYLPWAIALFGNERLQPIVEYFSKMVHHENGEIYVRYHVASDLAEKILKKVEAIRQGDASEIALAFDCLNEVIDTGVDQLIRKPKALLKFNLVVDKTLNGVIQVSTNMAYKRLSSLGREVELSSAPYYIDHFMQFLHDEA
ncbi:hypothetical protein [Acinetobacter nectaris]|uniref:hypothetical protein n=1 Tax=Acinetobacter nectaris TaxID=1219382 RepID=UPI001F3D15E9|nr:hypothetical protein [Acinetobacter nectaris]MCF8999371.1 hypothetical protein [Acinetobacter nectaris]MCF9026652.1 hypothetical protein [Acinetobacter nectaris]